MNYENKMLALSNMLSRGVKMYDAKKSLGLLTEAEIKESEVVKVVAEEVDEPIVEEVVKVKEAEAPRETETIVVKKSGKNSKK